MNEKNNIVLIDWFSFTSKVHSPESIIDLLGLNVDGIQWFSTYGMHGYKDRLYFMGISIHYNGQNEGVWVEMSGEGCRAFETFSKSDWSILQWHIVNFPDDYNITRLDIAYDDKKKVLNIGKIKKETEKLNFVSKFKDAMVQHKVRSKDTTIYFGSQASDIFFRVYDKAKEKCVNGHWIRFEIQMRDERAKEFLKLGFENIGSSFFGVVNNYLRFVKPDKKETNVSRLETAKWWLKFTDNVQKISLYTPCDLEYNLLHCENFVYRQAGNALDTLIKIKGIETVLSELEKHKPVKSKKYTELIRQHGVKKDDETILDFLAKRNAL